MVVSDSGVIRVSISPLGEGDALRAAQLLAGLRDARADGIFDERYELTFWHGRVRTCIAQGLAAGLFVQGRQPDGSWGSAGAPVGVLLALPDPHDSSRAQLSACNSMWGHEDALLAFGRAWAQGQKRSLGRYVTRWEPA